MSNLDRCRGASELFYQMSESYVAGLARGVSFDDLAFSIAWSLRLNVISARDAPLERYSPETIL